MSEPSSPPGRIAASALKLFTGTLASRVLGFIRVVLMARYFGGRAAMDIFNIAFMVPNLFRRVLGEQAVESAFLPTFRSLTARGNVRQAWRTASVVLNWLIMALLVAATACYLLAPWLVSWVLAPGFDPDTAGRAADLGRLMCPFMVLIGLAAFCGSLLLAHGQVWAYGLAPALFNVGWIATMAASHRQLGIYSLGLGVLIGGVLQLAASVIALLWGRRRGRVRGGYRASHGLADESASRAMGLAVPVCGAALIARCAWVVDRFIASYLEQGSIAALGYAMPLVLVPFALFGLSIGRAALAPLSEDAASGDAERLRHSLENTVLLGLLFLIPLTAGTALLATPFAQLLRGGEFGDDEVQMAAAALRYYALGLAGMGMVSILSRAMYAMKDTFRPLLAASAALVINAILSAVLAFTPMRHAGIALATSVAMTLQALFLFIVVRRKLRRLGAGGTFGRLWKPAAKMCIATAVMSATVPILVGLSGCYINSPSFPARLVGLLIPACGGAVVYGLAILLLDRQIMRRLR